MTSIAWAENFFKQSDIRIRTPGSPPADASAVPEANERGAGWAHPHFSDAPRQMRNRRRGPLIRRRPTAL